MPRQLSAELCADDCVRRKAMQAANRERSMHACVQEGQCGLHTCVRAHLARQSHQPEHGDLQSRPRWIGGGTNRLHVSNATGPDVARRGKIDVGQPAN